MTVHRKNNNTTDLTRRVTLINNPQISATLGTPLVAGLDAYGFQYQIDLTVLPPNITINMIKQGQQWFIERRTTFNRLFVYCGQFTPYSQLRASTPGLTLSSSNVWYNVPFTNTILTHSGSCGSIVVSGGQFLVPIPGLYNVTWNTSVTYNGTSQLYSTTQNLTSNYWSGSTGNDTLCLTSGQLAFSIQSRSPGTTVSGIFYPGSVSGWAAINYIGPVI